MSKPVSAAWLSLVTGNTRLHWGFFQQQQLIGAWHTPHLSAEQVRYLRKASFVSTAWQAIADLTSTERAVFPSSRLPLSAFWVAAPPDQAALWAESPSTHQIQRAGFPISGLYSTLGLDRAVNLLGAGSTLGWPVLVIDGGTALTFTAAGPEQQTGTSAAPVALYGGAILPGIRLQGEALALRTTTLKGAAAASQALLEPAADSQEPPGLPARWAVDTVGAIASGLAYGATATIADYLTDWWQQFPTGQAVLTGGDGPALYKLLQQRTPAIAARVQVDSHLMFWGMRAYRQAVSQDSGSITA